VAAEVARLVERDRIDSERAVAPLRRAEDAIELDTTGLSFADQVALIAKLVRERRR
jgi:cytidylate kinase